MRILAWGLDLGEHPYEKRSKSIRLRGERECLSQGRAGYILDANRGHLRGQELTTLEQFRQHVDDMEARHLGENVTTVGRRFPNGISDILTESSNA